jgi:hypothetical protein
MRSVDEYRRSAASMLDLAQRADSVADKNRLLVMAEARLDLAARAAKPTAADHPPSERRSGALKENSAYDRRRGDRIVLMSAYDTSATSRDVSRFSGYPSASEIEKEGP